MPKISAQKIGQLQQVYKHNLQRLKICQKIIEKVFG
jgi:hypothetical protein